MPFGSVALVTEASSGRTRTSSTMTPRSLKVAATALMSVRAARND
jgi:hypothetical protein